MKKILTFLLFLTISLYATAGQIVPVIWAFSPASNQATVLRTIIDNANKDQDKYTFVFENKPGAGGTIAVRHLQAQQTPTLLMISTSVFVRPLYYPDESYSVENLQPIAITATGSPLAIISKSYKSIDELKNRDASIGAVLGSITEAVAKSVGKTNSVRLIPYTSSIDSTRDAVAGHIDLSVEFVKDAANWADSGKAYIVGVTGTRSVHGYKTLSSQGVPGTDNLVSNYYMLANKQMSKDQAKEFNSIITKAMRETNVVELWKLDEALVPKFTYNESVQFWEIQKSVWNSQK